MNIRNLLLVITLAIPKAGTKIGAFPIYLSLVSMIYFMVCGIKVVFESKIRILFFVILLSLFVMNFFISFFMFGNGSVWMGFSAILAYILPVFAFLCYYGAYDKFKSFEWDKLILYTFYFLILYAFMQKIFGDYLVSIPGITANFKDATNNGFLSEKNNMIWSLGYLKATSTYQNGNLFGVNLLLIGFLAISSKLRDCKSVFILLVLLGIAVILTASASVYLGFLSGCFFVVYYIIRNMQLSKKKILIIGLFFLIVFLLFTYVFENNILVRLIFERLLERDISEGGGRTNKVISYLNYLADDPIFIIIGMLYYDKEFLEVYEIVPLAMMQMFGFFVALLIGFFIYFKLKKLFLTPYFIPFSSYLVASLFDGAYWLPPTSVNFFVLLSMAVSSATSVGLKENN